MSRPPRIEPGPGQESVWDYPRPPRVEPTSSTIRIVHGGVTIVETTKAIRVLETSQPPAFYLPPDAIDPALLRPSSTHTFCEWKGTASYVDLAVPGQPIVADAAWYYPTPVPAFASIAGYLAFYAPRVDACFVDGEQVNGNEGTFYGGWITSKVVGPFKGGDGSWGW